MEGARKCYNEQFKKIDSAYMDLVKEHSKLIIDYANNKVNFFIIDLQKQMKKLNSKISEKEETQYKDAFSKIEKLRTSISNLDKEVNGWYASV